MAPWLPVLGPSHLQTVPGGAAHEMPLLTPTPGGPSEKSLLSSAFTVIDLPTSAALAATASVWEANRLPRGVRIRFLASGIEFVDDKEEDRVKVGRPDRFVVSW